MKKTDTPAKTPGTPANTRGAVKPAASSNVRASQPVKTTRSYVAKEKISTHLFDKENYKWMLAGLVVIAIGFALMSGGKSSNPNVFQDNDVYSFRRITVAPILIIAGFIIEIFAIMRKPSANDVV